MAAHIQREKTGLTVWFPIFGVWRADVIVLLLYIINYTFHNKHNKPNVWLLPHTCRLSLHKPNVQTLLSIKSVYYMRTESKHLIWEWNRTRWRQHFFCVFQPAKQDKGPVW